MNEKKKKVIFDTIFSISAAALPLIILQIIIYPTIARKIPGNEYGIMITVFAALQLVSGTLGTCLNNVRLLKENEYNEKGIVGDFNLVMLLNIIIVFIVMTISSLYYKGSDDFFGILIIVIAAICSVMGSYYNVAFRIKLNFNKIFFEALFVTLGYLIGLFLFYFTCKWELVYLCAFVGGLVYILLNSSLIREPMNRTILFKRTLKDVLYMDLSGLCTRAMSYADKLILLPLIGGTQVSIYYTSTLIGKIVLLAMNPINSVILTYLTKMSGVSKKTFKLYVLVSAVICFVGYVICVLLSKPIIGFLFPQWVDEAMIYVPITTLNICILTFSNMLTPLTLRFCSMHWQFVINITTLIIYIGASLSLMQIFGLMGFCFGITCSYTVKTIMTFIVYNKNHSV